MTAVVLLAATSCSKENVLHDEGSNMASLGVLREPYRISIDSAYAYHGDSLYRSIAEEYYSSNTVKADSSLQKASSAKKMSIGVNSMTPEDEAFFSKKHTVTSTEATIYHGRNYIYPGAINNRPVILSGSAEENFLFIPYNNFKPVLYYGFKKP
ncbi:hypothetical protein [Sphingobacterium gobiense]|uniref:Uncharacterized protein n=1 Tax=Sphingobacterium gobiense TaxID=1382456 RepID=A0A2S9JUV1_9SPHI|nr:hypothetical protein [Sphingobacterium gobiense]PRD57056.1 hypothetical protein C5749_07575 [Sphingobacterium gobiense]